MFVNLSAMIFLEISSVQYVWNKAIQGEQMKIDTVFLIKKKDIVFLEDKYYHCNHNCI